MKMTSLEQIFHILKVYYNISKKSQNIQTTKDNSEQMMVKLITSYHVL